MVNLRKRNVVCDVPVMGPPTAKHARVSSSLEPSRFVTKSPFICFFPAGK